MPGLPVKMIRLINEVQAIAVDSKVAFRKGKVAEGERQVEMALNLQKQQMHMHSFRSLKMDTKQQLEKEATCFREGIVLPFLLFLVLSLAVLQ